jgi:ketosteroid isomerase-like protein
MSENKTTVERYIDACNRADREQILACVTDDVVWDIPRTHLGGGRAVGKEAFAAEAGKAPAGTAITTTRMVEDGGVVVAEGTVTTLTPDGEPFRLVFCDVFTMRGARISRLTSYLAQPE